jgi:hypothetical protein
MVEKTNKTEEKDKSLERVIGELFKALPKELQEAILEIGIREKVLRIGEKYNLPQKEIDFLENEVTKVLITINTEGEFVENTMDGLSLEDNQLVLLLDDIDNNIFTPVEDKLDRLEKESGNILGSSLPSDLGDRIREIGEKHALHTDEIGILGEEINKIISGVNRSASFYGAVQSKFGWNLEKTNAVVKDVDEQIFVNIRKSLKEKTSGNDSYKKEEILEEIEDKVVEKQRAIQTEEENLNKENILKEIENEPVNINQTEDLETPEETTNKDFLKGNVEAQTPLINKDGGTKPDMGKEMFEDKLTTPVKVKEESQEKDEDTKKSLGRKTYKGRLDPYREPID